jgi:hypothetical protein
VRAARIAALLGLGLLALGGAGCCGEVSRSYVVDKPDDNLSQMLAACMAAPQPACHATSPSVDCLAPECRDLCKSIITLAGDSPDGLDQCTIYAPDTQRLGGTTESAPLRIVTRRQSC